ncbi:MAG TPA: hypothetical protein VEU08_20480 [Vicinamibacterales bacterium]|nr:hypothetical protein [Vicinamibacterales bacterium]
MRRCLVITCLAAATIAAGGQRSVEVWRQKLAAITEQGDHPAPRGRRTTVTQRDLDAYLRYDAPGQLPAGVVEPAVTIVGDGRVSGRAVVDLDGVRKARKSTGLLDPISYLTGRVPVTASGVLKTGNGSGQFVLESTTVGGVPVPKLLLQEIVSYYSKTADKPAGIGLDDPFALPARIREIQVLRGQAIIVQ